MDPIKLAIDMLRECDVWAADALTAYIHKESTFDMSRMNLDMVDQHQQKIRIVIEQLKGEKWTQLKKKLVNDPTCGNVGVRKAMIMLMNSMESEK